MNKMEGEFSEQFTFLTDPTRLSLAFTTLVNTLVNQEKSLQLLLRYESTYRRSHNQAERDLLKLRESAPYTEMPNEPEPASKPTPTTGIRTPKPPTPPQETPQNPPEAAPDPPTEPKPQ